jgi:hypothetical protein
MPRSIRESQESQPLSGLVLDNVAAGVREIRSDVAAIDLKLVSLASIEAGIAAIRETLR